MFGFIEKHTKSRGAKCERDFKIAHDRLQRDIHSYPDISSTLHIAWVKPYLDEENLGIAILQRRRRLFGKHLAEQQDKDSLSKIPEYKNSTSSTLEQELARLREEYWKHQNRLAEKSNSRPFGHYNLLVEEVVLLRQHRDRHNRSFAWVLERDQCAARGGCCGRACACCERPLDQFFRPPREQDQDQGQKSEREVVEVLGHCTIECPCCIRFRGCYMPDPRLPQTAC